MIRLPSWRLLGISSMLALASAAAYPLSEPQADRAPSGLSFSGMQLPMRTTELIRAPQATWQPLLDEVKTQLDQQATSVPTMARPARIEYQIRRALLAQMLGQWANAIEAVTNARQLQEGENGREMAGLLNELLARHAQQGGGPAELTALVRDRLLAMPWPVVASTVRTLRDQLQAMKPEDVDGFVTRHLDMSAELTKRHVDLAFVMQLIGLRFQLLEVIPRRDALIAGIDAAIAVRESGK